MQEPSRSIVVVAPTARWQGRNFRAGLVRGTAACLLVIFTTICLHGNWPLALGLLSLGGAFWRLNEMWQRYCKLADILDDVDAMSPPEFTDYVAELLRTQAFTVLGNRRAVGPCADLLLTRGKEYLACWLQPDRRPLRIDTVAHAAAAVQGHAGWRALVLTSQRLTVGAWYRARREGCMLITRDTLASMVLQHRRGHKVIAFPREEATGMRGRK